MSDILCKVTKQYDEFRVEQIITIDEKDYPRLSRCGRVKRILDTPVNRASLGAMPPPLKFDAPGGAKRTNMTFQDKSGKSFDRHSAPQITFHPKRDEPTETPTIDAPEDNAERPPAVRPVGPDLTRPVGPDLSKYRPEVKLKRVNNAWWRVLVNGKAITNETGKPRHFRKADAEAAVLLLLDGKEV